VDTATFNALKYGNIVAEAGRKLGVTHTLRDATGLTQAIFCGGEAFQASDAPALTLVSSDYSRTLFQGAPDGSIILMGETVPGSSTSPTAAKK
jgi:hypothetical protein